MINLGKTEKYIVELNGDPSYICGNQKWKGAIDNLNKKKIKISNDPKNT